MRVSEKIEQQKKMVWFVVVCVRGGIKFAGETVDGRWWWWWFSSAARLCVLFFLGLFYGGFVFFCVLKDLRYCVLRLRRY